MVQQNLIYDVGMHKGEDTVFYLKKGFKVVGFEADPTLVELCKDKFSSEIADGRLVIVEGAIVDFSDAVSSQTHVRFFKNNDISEWGTVVENWAQRNEHLGSESEVIEVAAVDFKKCLSLYGIPHYLKIDIEGSDMMCLKSLLDFDDRPNYISIESDKLSFDRLKEEFLIFKTLGYTSFQAINQADIEKQREPKGGEGNFANQHFKYGSSGLFGKDLPAAWKSEQEILKQYKHIFRMYKLFGDYGILRLLRRIVNKFSTRSIPGWYDTHAKHHLANG